VVTNAYGVQTSSNALLLVWPLLGWGRDDYSQADIPGGLASVTGIAGGLYHGLALRADGTMAAWGAGTTNTGVSPQYGQSVVPAGLTNVTAVAAGLFHSLALKADGTVAAWGAGTTNTGVSPQFGSPA
jgi:alpha-tubulin suppressor-like RCC1 family protein